MLWTAFSIGLLGSVHCVGMCGPLAMAKTTNSDSKLDLVLRLLLYNVGRITTYILLGLMVGALGFGAELAGWQSYISIFFGVSLLLIAIFKINIEYHLLRLPMLSSFNVWLRSSLSKYFGSNSYMSWYRTGFFNGLLPCGLVYAAIIGAVLMGSFYDSALYMATFGLGTVPLMFTSVFLGKISIRGFARRLQQFYPIFLAFLGVLFIMRGANFDLPAGFSFLNPMQEVPMCHD